MAYLIIGFVVGLVPGWLYAWYWYRRAGQALKLEACVDEANAILPVANLLMGISVDCFIYAGRVLEEARGELAAVRRLRV